MDTWVPNNAFIFQMLFTSPCLDIPLAQIHSFTHLVVSKTLIENLVYARHCFRYGIDIKCNTPMFLFFKKKKGFIINITALFIIARTWKQPRCPSADEWIRKLWYIYTTEYYSAVKKNSFESVLMRWMKLEPIIQSEVSQKEKHQYSLLTHIYGI